MAQKTEEIQDIMQTLQSLQSRVQELSVQPQGQGVSAAPQNSGPVLAPAPVPASRGNIGPDQLTLLRQGIDELALLTKLKDFPAFFDRLAEQTGLRLILLKKWTTGLQVFMERNIKMPSEAKRKRKDGRAPIPCSKSDIFSAVGEDAAVYSGPVPVKHFPLDLTLMLGRGSKERQIIILPLPSQNHWNTFLYLDSDAENEPILAVAEVLAHYALSRMCLLNKGVRMGTGRVRSILQSEQARRRLVTEQRARQTESQAPAVSPAADGGELTFVNRRPAELTTDRPAERPMVPQALPENEIDPFVVSEPTAEAAAPQPRIEPIPLAPRPAPAAGKTSDALPDPEPDLDRNHLTPEAVLHHSGELPALPKAACHIMAVIEDPKTTATRLEKALAMDQTLTAKVLRIANSPFYGAVREIRTVSEAIVRLGFVTIRNWTVVTATKSVFLAPGAGSLYKKIWRQSVMSAMAGQLVAQHLRIGEPEGIFIGGLMQNIGQLVLARSHPELFQQILTESELAGRPYHEIERQLLGFDHGELGALLIKEWNLSRDLEDAVRWHHRFEEAEALDPRVAAMIALGEEVASTSGVQDEDVTSFESAQEQDSAEDQEEQPLSAACRYLGVSRSQLQDMKAEAAQLQIDPHFFN
nr:HDOD domain-containing protein [Candidatus Krumholzibacteria bacterium]